MKKTAFGCLIVFGALMALLIVFAVIGAAMGTSSSGKATATPTAVPTETAQATPTARPAPRVLLDVSGTGIQNTTTFTVPSQWQLRYAFNCAGLGSSGNFEVYLPLALVVRLRHNRSREHANAPGTSTSARA